MVSKVKLTWFNQFWSDVVTELNTAAFIANSFQNGIMHDVFAPEKLMYFGDGPIVSNRKDHPSEALQYFPEYGSGCTNNKRKKTKT